MTKPKFIFGKPNESRIEHKIRLLENEVSQLRYDNENLKYQMNEYKKMAMDLRYEMRDIND